MSSTQRTVGPRSSRWNFHTWERCDASGELEDFPDRSSALFWLTRFKSDPMAMADLRSLVSDTGSAGASVWRMNEEQVLEHVSWLLNRGVLHVHGIAPPATAWPGPQGQSASADAASAAPTSTPSRRADSQSSSASSPAKQADDPDTFSSQTDAIATAAVLRMAAESGAPFCEECAKAAAASKAA